MSIRSRPSPQHKYVVHVWGPEGWYVREQRWYRSLERACQYARTRTGTKHVNDKTLREVYPILRATVGVKDKSRPGRTKVLHTFCKGHEIPSPTKTGVVL